MQTPVIMQGRELSHDDIEVVRTLIAENPTWSRRRLSIALSTTWQWRNDKGVLKDMACRSLLVKLHERGYVELPARRQVPTSRMAARHVADVSHDASSIHQSLAALRPLTIVDVKGDDALFSCLLSRHHYLSYKSPVGENMKYLVADRSGRPLACLLFGSSAWSCASRDEFIGWDNGARQRNIRFTTNNTRFLVLPWVKVPHLASHVLALVSRRISRDWMSRYGHGVYLLETFVDQLRFAGTCYRAANWRQVGETRGRGRNDRYSRQQVPVKSVFVYPLTAHCQTKLNR